MSELPPIYCISCRNQKHRLTRTLEHLKTRGITGVIPFWAYDYKETGLYGIHNYEVDAPGSGFNIGEKLMHLNLSHQAVWQILAYGNKDAALILEDDAKFDEDWKERYDSAMSVCPSDWDIIYLGSCCAMHQAMTCLNKNLFQVSGVMCCHAYMVRKKAAPIMLQSQQKFWAPVDIALCFESHPKLKVYTILPRLADQFDTVIPA